jgi:cell division protein FtsN
MKNTSILIPIILIVCLGALIYLFSAARNAADNPSGQGGNDRIVLNPADYSDDPLPEDLGEDADLEPYFQEVPEDEIEGERAGTSGQPASTPATGDRFPEISETPADTYDREADRKPATDLPEIAVDTDGRYLVIAGSFRQLANAEARVKALRRSGFAETTLEKFNRGTYAVALAGRSDRYSEAARIAERVRAAGFEARVMKRR